MRLRNAVVLITGASSGIGAATALAFAKRRSRLSLCARRLDRLEAIAQRCRDLGAPAVTVRRADVRHQPEAAAFVEAALREFERIDVLVNNAGLGWTGRLEEMPPEKAQEMVETNLLGTTWCCQAALPAMLAAKRGVIVNVASAAAFRPAPYSSLYSATKAGLAAFGHALRGELSGTNVKVCTVYPGVTRTEFFATSGSRMVGPVYSTDWVANLIVRTARWPRRDAIAFPLRLGHLVEPVLGGVLDHSLGEVRRKAQPELIR
jgi:short-subunit dehydrogenase